MTFIDYHKNKFQNTTRIKNIKEIANIISWNIFQMDGMTYTVPYSREESPFISLFDDKDIEDTNLKDRDIFLETKCVIKDWKSPTKEIIIFKDLVEKIL